MKYTFILFSLLLSLYACKDGAHQFDASGSFEAEEIIVSALANGTIQVLDIQEGQRLKAKQLVGYVDSIALHLKKKQLMAQITAVLSNKPNVAKQLAALEEQLKTANRELIRIENLVASDAAPSKQLDDIKAQIVVINRQLEAKRSALQISTNGINSSALPLYVQIEILEDQLNKCRIINPVEGTVITKYAEPHEVTGMGKPLYKVADLSHMWLRAYITNDQLAQVKLNQKVKVYTDDGNGAYAEDEGEIIWINDKAEFTPKTVQTKNERANQVYAIKVKVKNSGQFKIGMYGEIKI